MNYSLEFHQSLYDYINSNVMITSVSHPDFKEYLIHKYGNKIGNKIFSKGFSACLKSNIIQLERGTGNLTLG